MYVCIFHRHPHFSTHDIYILYVYVLSMYIYNQCVYLHLCICMWVCLCSGWPKMIEPDIICVSLGNTLSIQCSDL